MKLKIFRNDLLVQLPPQVDEAYKRLDSGFYVATLKNQLYNPTSGIVKQVGESVKYVQVGDEIFFGNYQWQNAKERAWGSDDERFKGKPSIWHVYAFRDDTGHSMIIPETELLFIKRGDQIIPLNGYVIAEPIQKEVEGASFEYQGKKIAVRNATTTVSGLVLPDMDEENYKVSRYRVFAAEPESTLAQGDEIYTMKNCDLKVENELNNPVLPKTYFFIELEDILAKV